MTKMWRNLYRFTVIICLFFQSGIAYSQPFQSDYKIIAYMMGTRAQAEYPDSLIRMMTHINFAFAQVVDGEIAFQTRNPEHLQRIRTSIATISGFRSKNPDLKIILSVGGWGAEGFSDAAFSEASRKKFAQSGARMVKEYGFDGIDLDWEYPGQPGAGNVYRKEDKENFTLMLKELRTELDRLSRDLGRPSGKSFLLTIATGADQAYIDNTDLGAAQKYLDFINIMTYDFHSGLHPKSGHHTNLEKSNIPDATDISTRIAVDRHIRAGVPASKLIIGVPFYGRFWTGVPDSWNGMYQQSRSVGNYKLYSSIRKDILTNPSFVRLWDKEACAPYLYSRDSAMMISYDDPESLRLKIDYLKKNGLGGVMFWEFHGDYLGELLGTIYREIVKNQ